MKKLILICLSIVALNANAQLVVREAAKDTIIWQSSKFLILPKIVKFYSEGMESSYTIYYKNAKYTQISDIDYITTGDLETTKQFYELCKTVIKEDKEYNLEINNKSVSVQKGTLGYGSRTVMIWTDGSYFYLSDKYLNEILEKLK